MATLGTVVGAGSIAAGSANFTGPMTGSGNGYKGNFSGGFFGPAAAEVGFSFALRGSDFRDAVSGIMVGKRP